MDESNISQGINFQNQNSKKIDIFQHLRLNLKAQNKNCKDNNDNLMYCIPCKVTCCPECTLEEHKDHILVSKSRYLLTEKNIDNVFNKLNEKIQSNQIFNDYKIVENELIKQIEDMINELKNQIEKLRNLKIREMKNMFENFGKTISGVKNKIDKTKNDLKGYLNKNRKFFNIENNNEIIPNDSSVKKIDLNTPNKSNSSKKNSSKKLTKVKNNTIKLKTTNLDENSSLFLIHYELLNLIELKGKELDHELKSITSNINEYKENQKNYITKLIDNIKNLFFGEYNFSKEDYDNMNDIDIKKIIDESSPIYPINISVDNLDKENFDEITKRINQYNSLYDSFKKSVFDSVNKYGDLKDIENYISQF